MGLRWGAAAHAWTRVFMGLQHGVRAGVLLTLLPFCAAQAGDVQYSYDAAGRLVGVVDEAGASARYAYDASGNISTIERFPAGTLVVFALNPAVGAPGAQVEISGVGFSTTPSANTVTFAGTGATVLSATATRLTVNVPGAAASGVVSVTTGAGTAQAPGTFSVLPAASVGTPTISGFSPAHGGVGDSVTISGTNFSTAVSDLRLRLAGGLAAISTASSTSISAIVPAGGRSGPFELATPNGVAASSAEFTKLCIGKRANLAQFGTLAVGESAAINITDGTKGAAFSFSATSGSRVSFVVTGQTISYLLRYICDPSGDPIPPTPNYGDVISSSQGTSIVTLVIPSSGLQLIQLVPGGVNMTGNATLQTYDVPPDFSGTATPGGAGLTATTTAPGQNAAINFMGAVDQRVAVRISENTYTFGNVAVSITDPSAAYLLAPYTIIGANAFFGPYHLAAAGTYQVFIDPVKVATGSLKVTVYDVPPDPSYSVTPGGSPVTASTTTPGQKAVFTFNGSPGQKVSLNFTGNTMGTVDSSMHAPDGASVFSASFVGNKFKGPYTLSQAGQHTITVDPRDHNTGSVTLTLYDVPADSVSSIAPDASPVVVSTAVPGQRALLTFTGSAGQRVGVRFTDDSISGTDYYLLGPDGVQIDSGPFLASPLLVAFFGPNLLTQPGEHTIVVDPQEARTGSMTVTLYDVPPDVEGAISINGAAVTPTIGTPGQRAVYTFSGTAGQPITVVGTNSAFNSSSKQLKVFIYRQNGTTKVLDKTASTSSFTYSAVTLPATETYTLILDPVKVATGTVTVQVTSP